MFEENSLVTEAIRDDVRLPLMLPLAERLWLGVETEVGVTVRDGVTLALRLPDTELDGDFEEVRLCDDVVVEEELVVALIDLDVVGLTEGEGDTSVPDAVLDNVDEGELLLDSVRVDVGEEV